MQTCPALFISAPGSGHGKTTVTAALARFHTEQGREVRVFKTGPDFLDPMILARASKNPVYQLDLWMMGEDQCRSLVSEAAQNAELILIEGVMGLFDGQPSSADLAKILGVPVLAVIDAKGVAQTFGAIAQGLANYYNNLSFAGVLANSMASQRHGEMIIEGIPQDINYYGSISRSQEFTLPERHMGLVQAKEIVGLESRLTAVAKTIALTQLSELPEAISFAFPNNKPAPQLLKGIRIGVARDAAFAFIYQANLDLLQALGAELIFFSPLVDESLPEIDSLYLPGGYPELHLQQLQQNSLLKTALRKHFNLGKPIYAECGGMLYLLESLTDKRGNKAVMTGLMSGHAHMQDRLQGLGYQLAPMPGGIIRSHTFHHSIMETPLTEYATGKRLFNTSPGENIYKLEGLTASYLHCYFPSNLEATAQLFLP